MKLKFKLSTTQKVGIIFQIGLFKSGTIVLYSRWSDSATW